MRNWGDKQNKNDMVIRVNKNMVSHIYIHDFKKTWYEYKPRIKRKFLWFINIDKPERVTDGYNVWSLEQFIKNYGNDYVLKDGKIYQKPYINVYCGEARITQEVFNSYEEAETYCDLHYPFVEKIE